MTALVIETSRIPGYPFTFGRIFILFGDNPLSSFSDKISLILVSAILFLAFFSRIYI